MYTSIALTLAGLFAGQESGGAMWRTDYGRALEAGKKEGKPLAVFIATGQDGYNQVSRGGTLSPQAQQTLVKHYVCVYVDASQPAGRRLADAFAITKGRGLVLSNRTGELQAFHHDGDLADADLVRQLERFGNVTGRPMADSSGTSRVSYYAPNGSDRSGAYAPYVPYVPRMTTGRSC
jgi:hypothetical protein